MELHKRSLNICLDRVPQSRVEGERHHILLPLLNNSSFKVNTGFLSLSTTDLQGQTTLHFKGRPMHFQTRQQHPWLLPTRCPQHLQLWESKMSEDIANVPCGQISPVENWINAYTLCYFLKLKLTALPKPPSSSNHLFPGDLIFITIIHLITIPEKSSLPINSSNIKSSNSSHMPPLFCLLPLFSSSWICQSQFINA